MEKAPNKKNDTPNKIKLTVVLITCILLILAIFLSIQGHNESSETISHEYQKDMSMINITGNIWISKITTPETVIFEDNFIVYVEIVSQNHTDQTVYMKSRVFTSTILPFYSFSGSLYVNVPSNDTIVVEFIHNLDSEYQHSFMGYNESHSASAFPTSIEIYDNFNFTEERINLSRVGFVLYANKYSYMNPFIFISVILVTGYASLKIVDKKLKKELVNDKSSDKPI